MQPLQRLFLIVFLIVSALSAYHAYAMGRAKAPTTQPAAAPAPAVSAPAAAATPPASAAVKPATPAKAPTLREQLIAKAESQIGVQEKTGNNDGEVVKYLQATGLGAGNPYCAAFVYWCGRESLGSRNPFPKSAWSPDFVSGGTAAIASAKPGDTFGIWFSSKGRVAHTGLIRGWQGKYLRTVEANTSPSTASGEADRNGDGVWSKLRDPKTIYRIRSWLP